MIQTTAVIRERGQLTIPDEIRNISRWARPNSVIILRITFADEIVIQPYHKNIEDKVDWKKIWEGIRLVRSFKGIRGNLAEFIREDRRKH